MADDDEITIEGMLRQIIADHKDNEIDAVLVLVFQDGQASVYNSNMKVEIMDKIADILAVRS